jgi:hypothetical protein
MSIKGIATAIRLLSSFVIKQMMQDEGWDQL